MRSHPLFARLRRFHVPLGMLLVLLQRTPVLSLVLPRVAYVLNNTAGQVLKCAFTLAAMGTYDSLAGATTFTVVSATGTASGAPNSTFQVTGTVGAPINGATGVTFSVSGAPAVPKSFGVTDDDIGMGYSDTLPPGLSLSPFTGTTSGGAPFYNTNLKLSIKGTPTDAGTYKVRLWASDSPAIAGPNSGYAIVVFAITEGGNNVAPEFTTQPASATVRVGGSVTLAITASGSPPPIYQWYHGALALSGQTGASLSLSNIQAADAGPYTVTAFNAAGTVTSNVATLTVEAAASAPSISMQPQSVTVMTGASAIFWVTAGGTAPLSYQWWKNGLAIAGATSATYAIASASENDSGSYTVGVTNPAGSITSNIATLTISSVAPAITTQPAGQTVSAGASVTFTVVASGAPPPAYQWRKNNVNISGATGSSYTIASVTPGDAAAYTVVASNSAGSDASIAAVLTVVTGSMNDFNGDGLTDILWENISSGDHGLWIMSGTTPMAWINLPVIALDWRIAGTGDFNGDGQVDILWENISSGDHGLWIMSGTTPMAWINLPVIALDWRIAGTGDFNGDGQVDILWENVGSGDRGLWIMSGTVPAAWINLPAIALDWRIAGAGDFNGDGQVDILWENVGSGDRGLWIMSGTVPAAWINLPTLTLDWRIAR